MKDKPLSKKSFFSSKANISMRPDRGIKKSSSPANRFPKKKNYGWTISDLSPDSITTKNPEETTETTSMQEMFTYTMSSNYDSIQVKLEWTKNFIELNNNNLSTIKVNDQRKPLYHPSLRKGFELHFTTTGLPTQQQKTFINDFFHSMQKKGIVIAMHCKEAGSEAGFGADTIEFWPPGTTLNEIYIGVAMESYPNCLTSLGFLTSQEGLFRTSMQRCNKIIENVNSLNAKKAIGLYH